MLDVPVKQLLCSDFEAIEYLERSSRDSLFYINMSTIDGRPGVHDANVINIQCFW